MSASRTSLPIALLATLTLSACGTSGQKIGIKLSPPEAGLYLNGERVNQGSKGVYLIDFSQSPRCFLQATAHSYEPILWELTPEKVADQVNQYGEYTITLVQEK